jgi:hypothetical protein
MVQISYSVTVYTDQRIDVETLICGVPRFTNIFVCLGPTNPGSWLLCIYDVLEMHIIYHPMFGIDLVTFYCLASDYAL